MILWYIFLHFRPRILSANFVAPPSPPEMSSATMMALYIGCRWPADVPIATINGFKKYEEDLLDGPPDRDAPKVPKKRKKGSRRDWNQH